MLKTEAFYVLKSALTFIVCEAYTKLFVKANTKR